MRLSQEPESRSGGAHKAARGIRISEATRADALRPDEGEIIRVAFQKTNDQSEISFITIHRITNKSPNVSTANKLPESFYENSESVIFHKSQHLQSSP